MEPFEPLNGTSASMLLEWTRMSAEDGVTAGFTTRHGGIGESPFRSLNTALHVGDEAAAVVANRKRVAEALAWDFGAWTCAEQVHGMRVFKVTRDDAGRGRFDRRDAIPDADALVTDEPDVLLVQYFADCVPLYF
jgi:copper oxidase (laccase) domain-containing protein